MSHPTHTPWDIPADWPVPDAAAHTLSERLHELVQDAITAAGGWIDFAHYMDLVLYAPGLGYYSAGARKFGAGGDFVTAPEVSGLFSRCVARSCGAVLERLGGGEILELGAGSGAMAAEILRALAACGQLPDAYSIVERSADLRERQQVHLAATVPELMGCVRWLDAPPTHAWRGVLVANEVLDALPVRLFAWRAGAVSESGLGWRDDHCVWVDRPADADLHEPVCAWAEQYGWQGEYRSEINPLLAPWLRAVMGSLAVGAAMFIDYGYPRREYYHPERAHGTMLCHYRHRAHGDPLLLPGLQDITAHVDFTAVAEAAQDIGFTIGGFATQAHFLLDNGIERLLAESVPASSHDYLRLAAQAKTLLLPGEMGERFKALLLTRGLEDGLSGFRGRDLRNRL